MRSKHVLLRCLMVCWRCAATQVLEMAPASTTDHRNKCRSKARHECCDLKGFCAKATIAVCAESSLNNNCEVKQTKNKTFCRPPRDCVAKMGKNISNQLTSTSRNIKNRKQHDQIAASDSFFNFDAHVQRVVKRIADFHFELIRRKTHRFVRFAFLCIENGRRSTLCLLFQIQKLHMVRNVHRGVAKLFYIANFDYSQFNKLSSDEKNAIQMFT